MQYQPLLLNCLLSNLYRHYKRWLPFSMTQIPGGVLPLGGDADVRLQRPPIFSAAVTQWPHIFAGCFCCHPKIPHFWWNVGSLIAFTQRPPIFCIRLPQEATFCFNFIYKLIIFAIFGCKFLLLKRSLKAQSNVLTQCPLILNINLASHPMTPHFWDCVLTECPSLWKCEPALTPVSIWYWSAPSPGSNHPDGNNL